MIVLISRKFMFLPVFFLLICLLTTVSRAEIPKKINERQAYRLVDQAYGHKGESFNSERPGEDPPFYVYLLMAPAGRDGINGAFAVNPWTGEVWNLWGCHKMTTTASRRSQAKIKRRFTIAELKQYKRLSKLKPFCTVED